MLSLDKAADDLLANPRFQTWSKFTNYYNKEKPDKKVDMVKKLTHEYGVEDLAAILIAAKKVPSTEAVATSMQTQQFKRWLGTNEAPEYIFKLLQLEKAGDNLLANPQFKNWVKYADDFNLNAINNDEQASMIAILRTHYADDALANIVVTAKKIPSTQYMATRVEEGLFNGWMTTSSTPDGIFMHLKLDEVGEKLFESPMWGIYTKYLDHYNKADPEKKTTMISALMRGYDDEALAAILVAAKKVPSTEKLATKLQHQHWLTNKDPPKEVFSALMLDEAVDKLLTILR